jgi:ribosomal protein S27AE
MLDSKRCFKCDQDKPLSEFYKHKMMADGHLNKCKECTKKDTKENKEKNKDYYLEYDRQRANLPHRAEARLAYQQTPEGKEACRKAKEKWRDSNLVKRAAQVMVGNAIRAGKITKSTECSECGATGRIHGHHDDYTQPMVVRWLCSKCHTAWHKENGEGIM